MVQMPGWLRAEAAWASRRKRSRACESCDHIIGKKFQGDGAVEAGVEGFVDHTHSASTEFLNDAEVRDGLVNHG